MRRPSNFFSIMSYPSLLTTGVPHIIIVTFSGAICERTMVTLEKALEITHDWAVDRLHTLCDMKTDDVLKSVDNAHAIQSEFAEWLDPSIEDHEIYSLEYLGDND